MYALINSETWQKRHSCSSLYSRQYSQEECELPWTRRHFPQVRVYRGGRRDHWRTGKAEWRIRTPKSCWIQWVCNCWCREEIFYQTNSSGCAVLCLCKHFGHACSIIHKTIRRSVICTRFSELVASSQQKSDPLLAQLPEARRHLSSGQK